MVMYHDDDDKEKGLDAPEAALGDAIDDEEEEEVAESLELPEDDKAYE